MTLTKFLLARIAEDEAAVRDEVEVHRIAGFTDAQIDSHTRAGDWGPVRVLAECTARRHIIAAFSGQSHEGPFVAAPGVLVLQYLALPYADHPDYKPEWRP